MKKKRLSWNRKEDVFLIENYKKYIASELTEEFNREFPLRTRTQASVSQRLMKLNLKKRRRWTQKEIDYLLDRAGQVSLREIGKYLHRSVDAIYKKLSELGHSLKDDVSDSVIKISKKIDCSPNLIYNGIINGELKYYGRTNKTSGTYLVSIQDIRDYIVKKYPDKWFKCYESGKDVLGDIYAKEHLPVGFKKQALEPARVFQVSGNYSEKFMRIIDRERLLKKIDAIDFSEKLGYNPQWFYNYKNNKNKVLDLGLMAEMAESLGMSVFISLRKNSQ